MNDFLNIILRSIFSVTVLFALTRLNGKKQISQFTFFDYVIGISIGSIAAEMSIDKTVPIFEGAISLCVWAIFPIIIAFVSMKSEKVKIFFDGSPIIVIQNGAFIMENVRKSRFMVTEILEQLRIKGIFHVADVDYAIVETNGEISVLLKPHKQQIMCEDLRLPTTYRGLAANLIIDGRLVKNNLKMINKSEDWLKLELSKANIASYNEVLYACVDASGVFYVSKKTIEVKANNVI